MEILHLAERIRGQDLGDLRAGCIVAIQIDAFSQPNPVGSVAASTTAASPKFELARLIKVQAGRKFTVEYLDSKGRDTKWADEIICVVREEWRGGEVVLDSIELQKINVAIAAQELADRQLDIENMPAKAFKRKYPEQRARQQKKRKKRQKEKNSKKGTADDPISASVREHYDNIEDVVRVANENAMIEREARARRREPSLAQQMLDDLTGVVFTDFSHRSQWAHNKRHTEAQITGQLDLQHIENLDGAEAALALLEESGTIASADTTCADRAAAGIALLGNSVETNDGRIDNGGEPGPRSKTACAKHLEQVIHWLDRLKQYKQMHPAVTIRDAIRGIVAIKRGDTTALQQNIYKWYTNRQKWRQQYARQKLRRLEAVDPNDAVRRYKLAENILNQECEQNADEGRFISSRWLSWRFRALVKQEHGVTVYADRFWRARFRKRYDWRIRTVNNRKAKTVHDRLPAITRYLQAFRKMLSEPREECVEQRCDTYGNYPLCMRWNVDQVPLPFVVGFMKTLAKRGKARAHVATPAPSLAFRQATMQILCRGDGQQYRLAIVLKGKGPPTDEERELLEAMDIDVYWQDNAWVDSRVVHEWIVQSMVRAFAVPIVAIRYV